MTKNKQTKKTKINYLQKKNSYIILYSYIK